LGWGEPGNKRSETHCRLFFNDLTWIFFFQLVSPIGKDSIPLNLKRAKFSISSNFEFKGNPLFCINLLRTQTSVLRVVSNSHVQ
jgi:hypothetical protein